MVRYGPCHKRREASMRARPERYPLRFLGGRLCLDFVNSVENRASPAPEEFLTSYPALTRWGRQRGLLAEEDEARVLALAEQQPASAARALDEALALREALHRVFLALATAGEPDLNDLEYLQRVYADALAHARLRRQEDRFEWDWPATDEQLAWAQWLVAHSAAQLLTEGDLGRVRVCANPDGCGWLFYDGSKNGSRRWCSMEGCGSQVKMRRQYARRRAGAAAVPAPRSS